MPIRVQFDLQQLLREAVANAVRHGGADRIEAAVDLEDRQLRLRVRHAQLATPWMEYLFCTPEELEPILAPTRWELTDTYVAESTDADGARWPPGQWTAVVKLHG